ncbi:bifunctional diguanylate cyclase/phosphodiesterase [Accumulibacter sp.]|uniref:putative bifunctional diguanylate cyclase/phosphodiesterase n=1 Tax=Accumulibacter sp. TaxID=2053492 RepID=UPI0025FC4CFC|nr:bifunctional diguanylate cyclase/phosphodiesterase [Accumulibacter sp.]MCM8613664.1 bifunctional diguanylate cyclase/phosphodiesterase [Accumulibacter sp.]MCM8637308.1 bifunctional diguanylate cyclase/phosphodiesterase [Accumulibacter sp.]MCM8638208.1 bifunctional diguanylate cyclase/phosphodiesterase [Accumulibacter sp.]
MTGSPPARSDPTTGFHLRNAAPSVVARLFAATDRVPASLCAMWLDLDRFRQVNDSFGYAEADAVIALIAGRIRSVAGERATLLRMGSDEFAILLSAVATPDAERIAGRLLATIDQPIPLGGILLRPSVSIGITWRLAADDPLSLLARADRAMGEAKRQGGDRFVVVAAEPLGATSAAWSARQDLEIESVLHASLATGDLDLHYQPIVRPDGSVEAVEALMRCAVGGRQVSPLQLVAVAEKTGLIVRIGEWILLQGARCAARLRAQGCPTKVAINISRLQLYSESFLGNLHAALICARLPADAIELELTESLFVDASPVVQANLRGAREAGVGLAIDDFGTGYSSLANLKDLPATKLKFDRAFINELPEDRRAFAILSAITRLAGELGMVVVAEGVETAAQLAACEAARVDATQGFLHAKPMSEEELSQWMETRKAR